MLLLLIRHADAGDRDAERWPDDRDRPLTDKGRKTQRKVSRWLGEHRLAPTKVLTSPWARAAETAKILVDELHLPQPPMPCAALATSPISAAWPTTSASPAPMPSSRSWGIRRGWRSWPACSWRAQGRSSGSTFPRAG